MIKFKLENTYGFHFEAYLKIGNFEFYNDFKLSVLQSFYYWLHWFEYDELNLYDFWSSMTPDYQIQYALDFIHKEWELKRKYFEKMDDEGIICIARSGGEKYDERLGVKINEEFDPIPF